MKLGIFDLSFVPSAPELFGSVAQRNSQSPLLPRV
jgi:hypothetical protein